MEHSHTLTKSYTNKKKERERTINRKSNKKIIMKENLYIQGDVKQTQTNKVTSIYDVAFYIYLISGNSNVEHKYFR